MPQIWKNYEKSWVLDMFMGQIMENVVHVCYIYNIYISISIYIYTPTFTPNMAPNEGKHVIHGIYAVIIYIYI